MAATALRAAHASEADPALQRVVGIYLAENARSVGRPLPLPRVVVPSSGRAGPCRRGLGVLEQPRGQEHGSPWRNRDVGERPPRGCSPAGGSAPGPGSTATGLPGSRPESCRPGIYRRALLSALALVSARTHHAGLEHVLERDGGSRELADGILRLLGGECCARRCRKYANDCRYLLLVALAPTSRYGCRLRRAGDRAYLSFLPRVVAAPAHVPTGYWRRGSAVFASFVVVRRTPLSGYVYSLRCWWRYCQRSGGLDSTPLSQGRYSTGTNLWLSFRRSRRSSVLPTSVQRRGHRRLQYSRLAARRSTALPGLAFAPGTDDMREAPRRARCNGYRRGRRGARLGTRSPTGAPGVVLVAEASPKWSSRLRRGDRHRVARARRARERRGARGGWQPAHWPTGVGTRRRPRGWLATRASAARAPTRRAARAARRWRRSSSPGAWPNGWRRGRGGPRRRGRRQAARRLPGLAARTGRGRARDRLLRRGDVGLEGEGTGLGPGRRGRCSRSGSTRRRGSGLAAGCREMGALYALNGDELAAVDFAGLCFRVCHPKPAEMRRLPRLTVSSGSSPSAQGDAVGGLRRRLGGTYWVSCVYLRALRKGVEEVLEARATTKSTTFPALAARGASAAYRYEGLGLTVNIVGELRELPVLPRRLPARPPAACR